MGNEWHHTTWGELISLEYGKRLQGYKDAKGPVRVYGSNGAVGWTAEPLAPGPGVILGRKGACRGVEYSRDPFFVIDTAYYVKPRVKTDVRWLYYAIKHYRLGEIDDGSPIPSTTRSAVYVRPLELPPLDVQRRIAHILGTLDDKIELNRRMNRTLERMAAAIFKSWFIDFDPIHAKAEARDPGLPQQIADLFPDSFQDSELGPIPEGWEVKPLPEVISVNPKRVLPKGTNAPYVEMKAMPTELSRPDSWPNRVFKSGSKFINGDVLLARITPCLENGKTAFVDFLADGQVCWGSTEYIVFCAQPPVAPEFTYFLARSDRLREHAISNMTGTSGRQRVPPSCFDNYLLVVPPEPLLDVFRDLANAALCKTRANDEQSRTLARLRDTLLRKLLSGEIDESVLEQLEVA